MPGAIDTERDRSQYPGRNVEATRNVIPVRRIGHVDDIARFVAADTVVLAVEEDSRDPNHEPLQDNLERLRSVTTLDGRPLTVVRIAVGWCAKSS